MQIKFTPAISILSLLILSACANVTPAPLPPTPTTASVTKTDTPLPAPSPTPNPTSTVIPLNLNPQVVTLAKNLPEPDDLLLDGSLIFVEQGINRLTRYDFSSGRLAPFLSLENKTKNMGVDGILWTGSELIVPDSPNGRILSVSPDGKTMQQLATGFARPTGAWLESTGDLLIADENGNAVFRLHADDTFQKVANYSIPDDVIEDASGNIFVTTLGDNAVHILMAQTKQDVILVKGLNSPQGIIFDAGGNLIVTDSGNHRLLKIIIR